MDLDNYEYAAPNASALIQSLRAFGYDISTAIADLIDNSITAQSKRIDILFDWNQGNPWIAIVDDGYGMNKAELLEAMRPGSKSPLESRSESDLGRFGLGLKTASFSQCKCLTVASKKESTNIRKWDLDLVTATNQWRLLKEGSPVINKLIIESLDKKPSGTIVLWEKLDRIIPEKYANTTSYQQAFTDFAAKVKKHISLTFMDFMQGANKILFYVNNMKVEPWDPFFSKDQPELTFCQQKTELYNDGQIITVRPYVLPHPDKLKPDELRELAGDRGWSDLQGFYIFRNRRLIIAGEWLLPGLLKKDLYRLSRIRIDINSENDSEWNIDVKKSTAMPPVSIQDDLRRIARNGQVASSSLFKFRGRSVVRSNKNDKTFIWHQYVRNKKIGYSLNRDHPIIQGLLQQNSNIPTEQILKFIEDTVPVPAIIEAYTEDPDQMLRPYEGSDSNKLLSDLRKVYFSLTNDLGLSPADAIDQLSHTEPFLHWETALGCLCSEIGFTPNMQS
jgi:hypothetical protein